ncbi:MAG TPA: hypothetical protein VG406_11450 [Isosphaeraceae bacterium]|nr:hypothetical protein [Isosphaeraceae bacterium]
MDEFNPFAPPKAGVGAKARLRPVGPGAEIWWEGDALVVPKGAVLPDVCVKCGDVAVKRLRRNLSWHNPVVYILMVSPLIYIIVALIVRKTGKVEVGLCGRHARRRLTAILIGWTLALAGIAGMVLTIPIDMPELGGGGAILFFIGLLCGAFGARTVYPERIDTTHIWLKGVQSAFPASVGDPLAWPAEAEL